jgi:hypothetical protein
VGQAGLREANSSESPDKKLIYMLLQIPVIVAVAEKSVVVFSLMYSLPVLAVGAIESLCYFFKILS